ncbi:alpha/beta fold hydrolase [Dyella telluris]|uniref:Alpha/beta hydrolase n=1 Tax=Dyella telluris TaxID=2763498 RepID=A0A7G8Q1V5_9GAMM|nr:alpha/beta hydrolase [Dyella telluris]QNK00763.1 alpha/beta hydrolase [Dyella telluris]
MKNLVAGLLCLSFAGVGCAAPVSCAYGVYGEAGKAPVVISNPTAKGAQAPERYTFIDGRRGDVNAVDAPVRCAQGVVSVRQADGRFLAQPKVALRETPTHFKSHGTELAGVLIEPAQPGGRSPLVVFVHGSEKTPGIGGYYPYMFAAQGLSVFAYDKRGTGASDGDYTQNFELLADDAAAALDEARKLGAGRYSRAGFFGGSQGGWVAPRAAALAHADFVAVGFGLVMTPLEEDQQQAVLEMQEKGYDAASMARVREVTDATGAVMASHFTSGFDQLAAVKRKFANEPWLHTIEGEYTGEMLAENEADLRRTGAPRYDNLNILWNYDAVAAIRALDIPQLWVIAGEDRDAPGAVTRERLTVLKRAGKPIDLYVFPHTDHGMYEFVQDKDGTRHVTRITDGYFRLLADWIRQQDNPPYGTGERLP